MSVNDGQPTSFESVKARLAEIADAVDDDALSLDDALDLYEEAVALGLQASDLLETGMVDDEEEPDAAEAADDQSYDGSAGSESDQPEAATQPSGE